MAEETPRAGDPVPSGVCQVTEKMEKRTCAFCPKGEEWSVMYFAPSENIAAHENCLLYSSALVECEAHDNLNKSRNFAVKSVKKEIWRGRRLKCTQCSKGGATVGCDLPTCSQNYHFSCAKKVNAVLQVDEVEGTYKLFCQKHAPELPGTSQSDATAKVPFLKKCKEAGLLTELFEGILEKLDSIQGKLLSETASESGTESA
uniref:PHD-type domain-containing protein n=1 Tax=Peromyscus maniculatus bairdii TaxID=230844 RepID=A0A8C8U2A6_PERMB